MTPSRVADDPSVILPAAVRRASANADSIHKQAYATSVADAPPVETPPAPAPTPTPEAPAPAAAAPPAPRVIPETAPTGDSWENRYKAAEARFSKNHSEFQRLADRLAHTEQLLSTMSAPPPAPTPPELQAKSLLTPEERAAYGDEFLDVVAKQAREAVQKDLDARDKTIAELRAQVGGVAGQVAGDARDRLIKGLDVQLPNWRDLNVRQEFLDWLALPDTYSGANRHALLTRAFEQNDLHRVLAFFKGFLTEEAAVAPAAPVPANPDQGKPGLEVFAAPGRARSAAAAETAGSPEKPVITRPQISQFYADVRAGKYRSNEQEKNRLEAMIFEAEKDGRIR